MCSECSAPFSNNETIYVSDGKAFCEQHAPSTEEDEEEWDDYDETE